MSEKKRSLFNVVFMAVASAGIATVLIVAGALFAFDLLPEAQAQVQFHSNVTQDSQPLSQHPIIVLMLSLMTVLMLAFIIAHKVCRQINSSLKPLAARFESTNNDAEALRGTIAIQDFESIAQAADTFASRQQAQFKELQRLSQRDPLTDLYNRRHMSEVLILEEARIKRNRGCFGLIVADIDYFKRINDTYGHEAGDKTIRAVANVLVNTLRKQDLVSRWGGEEFLILLPDAPPIATLRVAEKLCNAVNQLAINYKGHQIQPTLTCGVTYHDSQLDLTESIDRADQALYEGKRSGRNKVVPKAPMDLAFAASA